MATIAMTWPPPAPHHSSSGLASLGSGIGLQMDVLDPRPASSTPSHSPTHPPVPNKHIPVCPPGLPVATSTTPSPSPPLHGVGVKQSLLFPPGAYSRIERDTDRLALYRIDAPAVAAALDYLARQPLPDPALVFPWLHGLHPNNQMQHDFFAQRRRVVRSTPCCLRGITVVKAGGNLNVARLKGAIAPDEIIQPGSEPIFLDADPREGFSVRNFQIQTAKTATTSDIIVYGDDLAEAKAVAWSVAAAQQAWREQHTRNGHPLPVYNTFLCTSPFAAFEAACPEIVAVDAQGRFTNRVIDLYQLERREMYAMTMASEISHNVWLGPTPDPLSNDDAGYDILIECSDIGHLNPRHLEALATTEIPAGHSVHIDFPASGTIMPPTWSQAEADGILDTCKWIYHLAHGTMPVCSGACGEACKGTLDGVHDADTCVPDTGSVPSPQPPRRILIHCADGYTESTMLGIAYFSYSTARTIPEAWLDLHTVMHRNFFAYASDVALLTAMGPRLLCESPVSGDKDLEAITAMLHNEPGWFGALDGSLPSRILDYMYLGNVNHANNPELLNALGITQILSVGEMAVWRDDVLEAWGEENVCVVQGVQDNGIDPLTDEFQRCLDFLDRGRQRGTATLVHCRVGVSRSATICIAEVMRSMKLSLPRAYCFVRARRLNVIIQPHLRFAYELLKWEETLLHTEQTDATNTSALTVTKRELEWNELAREVALMNRPYCR